MMIRLLLMLLGLSVAAQSTAVSQPCPTFEGSAQWRIATDMKVENGYAFCLMKYYGLLVLDIHDPSEPQVAARLNVPGQEYHGHYNLSLDGTRLYSARQNDGVTIID